MKSMDDIICKAASRGDITLVRELLDKNPHLVNAVELSRNRWTPLHWASSRNDCEMADLLISKGARIDSRGNASETPLHLANHIDMARLLISRGSPANPKDRNGMTPLDFTMAEGNTELVKFLMSHINPEAKVIVLPPGETKKEWN